MKNIIISFVMIALTGCPGPVPGVSVVREDDHYVFTIRECRSKSWKMPVWNIDISLAYIGSAASGRSTPRDASLCRMWFDPDDVKSDLTLERWVYGVAPVGFVLGACQPLVPGNVYKVDVDSRPNAVVGHFAIEADGAVRMIDGDCKK